MFSFIRRRRIIQSEKSYALLAHKLGRRLGIARSRARQAEQEATHWRLRSADLQLEVLELRRALRERQREIIATLPGGEPVRAVQ